MSYIQPKVDYKDGDVLHGIDLNASNEVIKAGVDDNFDRIQALEADKQNVITIDSKIDYSLIENTPDIPSKTSDLDNDSGFITDEYHDDAKQDVLTAGTGISIENNVISNTQTSAEWGNIQGDIEDQTDLINEFDTKQDTLESGVNIKTINNQSILGSGNLSIGGGSGGTNDYDQLENRPQINDVTLSGNKSLEDLGIQSKIDSSNKLPYSNISGTPTIPTKISDLTNDNNTVTDADYVHTDNNYTSAEKTKLSGIESGAQVNVDEIVVGDESLATTDTKLIIEESDLDFQGLDLDYIFPIGKVELFFDSLDHSNYLGLQWEQVGAGKVPVGLDTNDTDFNTIGKTGGSKTHKHLTPLGFDPNNYLYGYAGSDGNPAYGSSVVFNIKRNSLIGFQQEDNTPARIANTDNASSLQPYIVMAFWRRIA